MSSPKCDVALLLSFQTDPVPVGSQQRFQREHRPDFRSVQTVTFKIAVHHNVQQSFQWGARLIDRAVFEVRFGDSFVGFRDVLNSVGEGVQILRFRLEDSIVEDFVRVPG